MSINQALKAVDARERPIEPLKTSTLTLAKECARHWFHRISDRAGEDYIHHCQRVAHNSRQICQQLHVAPQGVDWIEQFAWLHDLFSMTKCSPVDLYDRSSKPIFGFEMIACISILTKDKERDGGYVNFCGKLAEKAPFECLIVKIACNLDESDPNRLDKMPLEFQEKRKWKKGRALLYRGLEKHFAPDKVLALRNSYKYVDQL